MQKQRFVSSFGTLLLAFEYSKCQTSRQRRNIHAVKNLCSIQGVLLWSAKDCRATW